MTLNENHHDGDIQRLVNHILTRSGLLRSGQHYSASEVFGAVYWNALSNGHKRQCGIYLSQLVEDKAVPFELIGKTNENKKIYRLQ